MEKKQFIIGHDTLLKWENNGKLYALHIVSDPFAESPRADDDSHLTTMACFVRRHALGDDIDETSPEEFWANLVRKTISADEFFNAAKEGRLKSIQIRPSTRCEDEFIVHINGYLPFEEDDKNGLFDYIDDSLPIADSQELLKPYYEWLPLWIYEHSGMSMSYGTRTGQYADPWDSGCAGWIIAKKSDILKDAVDILRDEQGKPIMIEHKHDGAPSTYSVKTAPLTEETWRKRAIEIMECDVVLYDAYLRGDVYSYSLFESSIPEAGKEPEWEECDHCGGFYGYNIYENGMLDTIGNGLETALASGEYQKGEVRTRTISTFVFP